MNPGHLAHGDVDVMLEPLAWAAPSPGRTLLEIGGGVGFASDYAQLMLGWRAKGYDPSPLGRIPRPTAENRPLSNSPSASPANFPPPPLRVAHSHARSLSSSLAPNPYLWIDTYL